MMHLYLLAIILTILHFCLELELLCGEDSERILLT